MWPFKVNIKNKISKLYSAAYADGLAELMKNEKLAFSTRVAAVEALAGLGMKKPNEVINLLIDLRAVDPLIAALEDKDLYEHRRMLPKEFYMPILQKHVLKVAANALGQLGDLRAVEPLIAALKNPDFSVLFAAVNALVKLGDLRVVEPLIAALKGNWCGSAEAAVAAKALGQLGDLRAVEPLIAALEYPLKDHPMIPRIAVREEDQTFVRKAAAEALGQLGDLRAVEPLIAELWVAVQRDRYPKSAVAAAEALAKIGGARAVEALIDALEVKEVRQAAADALDATGWQPDEGRAGAAYWVAKRNWDRCVLIGAPAVEPLMGALEHHLYGAVEALARIGAPAVEPLIAALKPDRHRDPHAGAAAAAAAEALGQIGDLRAVEPLIAALKNSDFSFSAVDALVKLGDLRAVEPLMGALAGGRAADGRAQRALVWLGSQGAGPAR